MTTEWLRSTVFPDAVASGSFGADLKFISYEPRIRSNPDETVSDDFFGDVILENAGGEQIKESVYVKVQTRQPFYHKSINIDAHFYNEVLFYTEFVPLLRKYDTEGLLSTLIPEFIYGRASNGASPNEDVIIEKDLSLKGFKMSEEPLFLPEKCVQMAVDRLGKFHALAMMCLHENPDGFHAVVAKIQSTFLRGPSPDPKAKDPFDSIKRRGIEPLVNDPEYGGRLDEISKHCEYGAAFLRKYMGPSESINVLTHGDLIRHNLMFRFNSEGDPEDVVFCDWACIRYCSPVVDLGLFLMLDTSPELKRSHWDSFLQTYYSALSGVLDGHAAKPSLEDFDQEMRKKGVYGYHWSVYMLPQAMVPGTPETIESVPPENLYNFLNELGGPKATEYLTELVKHMLDKNFIFEISTE